MLTVGTHATQTTLIEANHTAKTIGSGNAEVLATPFLIALIEKNANEMCFPYLEEGTSTVGTEINLQHLAATPVGMKVTVHATVTEAEGRKIVFSVEAYDEKEKIAEGTHTRFIVFSEKFQAKCNAKLD